MSIPHSRLRREVAAAGCLLLAGMLARLYAAWCFRHVLNLDAGVVALMAKHIAEGGAFPVFFYGQPYMGSFEVLFGALFCRLFGVSGFAVCLGTVFVSFWLMPVVYLWARDAAGHKAGCLALAYVVIGPGGFFHYNASPRGGYAAILTLSAFLVWYSTRMALVWYRTRRQSGRDFVLLGLAAGVAWWSSQLTVPAMFAAGAILALVLRRALFTRRLLYGVGGFLLGSSPFWFYNIVSGWPSFQFVGTFGRARFSEGLILMFRERLPSLILPAIGSPLLRNIALLIYSSLAFFGLIVFIRSRLSGDKPLFLYMTGLVLFFTFFSIISAGSHFAAMPTPRYALPMVAPIAVLSGIVMTRFRRRFFFMIACVPFLFLVAMQVPVLRWALESERADRRRAERILHVGDMLAERGLDTLYASYVYRAWNFILRERSIFVDATKVLYLPHAQQAELADNIAVLRDYGDISDFVERMCGRAELLDFEGCHIYHDIAFPEKGYRYIEPEQFESATDALGRDVVMLLTDGREDTYWNSPGITEDDPLVLEFRQPVFVNGFRIVATHNRGYPFLWSLEGRTHGGDWVVIHDRRPLSMYFQSGPRFYWSGRSSRMEAAFPRMKVTHLRFTHHRVRKDFHWSIHTLQVTGPDEPVPHDEEEWIGRLLIELRERGIGRLYADRWASNKIHVMSDGAITTAMDNRIFSDRPFLADDTVAFTDDTAMLVRVEDGFHLRRSLSHRGISWDESVVGPWVLFANFAGRYDGIDSCLRWTGFGALRDDSLWAKRLTREAMTRVRAGLADATALDMLDEALLVNPVLYRALTERAKVLRAMGMEQEAEEAAENIRLISQPEIPAHIRFCNGLEFLGYALDVEKVIPGESFSMTGHWRFPADLDFEHLVVFVHFRRDGILFQDDHYPIGGLPNWWTRNQIDVPIVMGKREIHVPDGIAPGPVEMFIGVYDRTTWKRLRPKTGLQARERGVIIPDALMVIDR